MYCTFKNCFGFLTSIQQFDLEVSHTNSGHSPSVSCGYFLLDRFVIGELHAVRAVIMTGTAIDTCSQL